MSKVMKHVRVLEATGFQRAQAEAQVQMVLDIIDGDLVTKADFAVFKEQIRSQFENRFSKHEQRIENTFTQFDYRIQTRLEQFEDYVEDRFEGIDSRFEGIDRRFEGIDKQFAMVEDRFKAIDKKLDRISTLLIGGFAVAVPLLAWLQKS